MGYSANRNYEDGVAASELKTLRRDVEDLADHVNSLRRQISLLKEENAVQRGRYAMFFLIFVPVFSAMIQFLLPRIFEVSDASVSEAVAGFVQKPGR